MKLPHALVIYSGLPVVIGALLGAALGYFGQCTSGMCPLTSTWWRGAIYGVVMGGLFAFCSKGANTRTAKDEDLKIQKTKQFSANDD